eukprot:TRINITY_DN3116_c2_g1_i1.p1 TRINITY_DN3116_c2_g1~~TRINITY_DN3116_c2_g1_i1.p1  ORF type:complete len:229 (+),score=65.60 TRINITY_DN3116_c2_g1_i1:59-745(+)
MAAAIVEGIVQEAGTFLAELAGAPRAWLVSPGELAGDLSAGDLEELHFLSSSSTAACKVLAIDTISRPNRAKVELMDAGLVGKIMVVPVLDDAEAARWSSSAQEEGHPEDETAMVDGKNMTIYQDYDDAFDLAADRLAASDAERCAATAAPQAEATAPLPAESADPGTAGAALAVPLEESSSKLFRDLRKGLSQEFEYFGEDLRNLAAGAADVAAVGTRALFPAVKAA